MTSADTRREELVEIVRNCFPQGMEAFHDRTMLAEKVIQTLTAAGVDLGGILKVNLNRRARVKLTDAGRKAHRDDYDHFFGGKKLIEYTPPKEDAEGYFEDELWSLIHTFGPAIYMGRPALFDRLEIQILPDEFALPTPPKDKP